MGSIIGCFDGIHGASFVFSFGDVVDPSLRNFLQTHQLFNNPSANCNPTSLFWVTFAPIMSTGPGHPNHATNIFSGVH
ncbi:MAG: hypothetical protein QOC99_2222 [Acidobacteriota bacterium]|jgi:hypothetical protein|nr:hypothetical protein [Acidobacteriota bacterium]MDT7779710.1 hypothetical protein [Acidobacteriota bacterium]